MQYAIDLTRSSHYNSGVGKIGKCIWVMGALLAAPAAWAELSPCEFTSQQTNQLIVDLQKGYRERMREEELIGKSPLKEVKVSPQRNDWLREVYDLGIVEPSESDRLLWSKTITQQLLEKLGTNPDNRFYPKTIGLKCFLEKYNLLGADHAIEANADQIRVALSRAFPTGFVVLRDSPVIDREDNLEEFYRDPEVFVAELIKPESSLYTKDEYYRPFYAKEVNGITSGEKIILQASVLEPRTYFVETRVHTLEHRVVDGAVFNRFQTGKTLSSSDITRAKEFVEDFLKAQPPEVTRFHAWSLDIALLSNGKARILHILTNRGNATHWSRFQSYPSVLGAYTRHIERFYNVKFTGLSGFLLRNDMGNVPRFLRKKLIDGTL